MEIGEDEMVGAIFMCNRATKKECFRSKIFGLPSRYAEFVDKVKAGMLLFLFEYEERKLYGVFEAATDGAININTSAFSKTKGTFPAQVVYKTIWKCHPLTEVEFKDAIQDNYFAPYKFHFGLSHEQVSMLLDLFSQRKLMPKSQRSADFHESYRLENANNVIRKEKSASMDEMDFGSSLDYEGAVYEQHSELAHKIHGSDSDLRDHLTRDRYRNRDTNSNELHTSLDRDSKDRLEGKHTLYTHAPDLVFKKHGDLDNESRPYHISQCDYQPHNVIGSTSQLDDYFPQDYHRLSPKTQQTYPNYGIESTSATAAPKLIESKRVPLKSHLYSSYPDLDNYRYSSTGYLKEGKCNKIGTDVSNLPQNFTSAAYPSEEFNRTIPLNFPSDNPDSLQPISTERYLNFDYDSLALKYSANNASNIMDYAPSLDSHYASRLGYRKSHPESSNSAYMDKGEITASMEATHDLTRLSLEPNSTAKELDLVKGYCTRQQALEPYGVTGYDTAVDHYRNIYPSEFSNANDYETKSLELQLETPERRSVFSRLSKTAKMNKIYSKDDKSPSQLLNILAQRKKSWKKIASSPKGLRSINHGPAFKRSNTWIRTKPIGDDLTKESKESTKGSMDLSVKKIKQKSPIEDEDVESKGYSMNVDLNKFKPTSETTASSDVLEGIHEEAMEVLVKNFKRRSVTQEKTGENAEKGKRRKLIRPSFCDNNMEGVGNEGSLAIEPCNNSTGISTCKEHFVAKNSRVQDRNTDVSFDQNSNRSIKAKPMEEENIVASHIQHDTVEMAERSGFTAENKKSDASFGQKSNFGIKVEPMEEERMVLLHTHNDKPNDTNEVAESSGFTAGNKKSDVSFGQKLNTSIKAEVVEEEHMLSQTHNDKPKDANEVAGGTSFRAENLKLNVSFGQKLNTSIKVEPMEEENMLLPHIHNDNANDTNEVVENSGYQIVDKKTEVDFDPKCNARIKVEPMEEEHIMAAHTQNDMHNETTEMVESSGKDSEKVSNSSVANNAIVLGKKVASSRLRFDLISINKGISSLEQNANDINAEIFQADFGAEGMKSSKENTDINSFKSPNLFIETDEVKERLENSSDKTFEDDTRINSDKSTSLSTNSVVNKIKTSEIKKNSGTFINLNEVATPDGVIAEEFRIEPDTAAGF